MKPTWECEPVDGDHYVLTLNCNGHFWSFSTDRRHLFESHKSAIVRMAHHWTRWITEVVR